MLKWDGSSQSWKWKKKSQSRLAAQRPRRTTSKLKSQSSLAVLMAIPLLTFSATSAHAVCINPAGTEGEVVYNTTHNVMQFCDGTDWVSMARNEDTLTDVLAPCNNEDVAKWNTAATEWQCGQIDGSEDDPYQ